MIMALTLTTGLFAQPKGYKSYTNEKYQYSVLIPDNFGGMGESELGDGQIFVSPDGETHIRAFGGYNAQTIFGTSFNEEYQSKLQELKDRKVELLETGTADDPDEQFDWAYYFYYIEDGLYHVLRTVWWNDFFATAEFWCYQDDRAQYEEKGMVDVVVYSIGPDDGTGQSESDQVFGWFSNDDMYINVYVDGTLDAPKEARPVVQDFFHSFATSFQTPLTLLGLEKVNDPAFDSEEITEWVLDNKNNYFTMLLVSDSDYWMEACVFDKDNGHKLFVVNYNAPDQALMCFDYNPKEQIAYADPQTLQLLQQLPKAIVRLPRQGKTMEVYYYKDLSKPVGHLTWNGNGFNFTQK